MALAPRKAPAVLRQVYRRLARRFGPQHWWPGESPFEVIVGAILTQNTAWSNVERAIENLRSAGVLTPERMRALPRRRLADLIRPAGTFNIKAKRLSAFLAFLDRQYRNNLERMFTEPTPLLRERLLSIQGIGPETADSILLYAGGHPQFVVDQYTRRVFSRHGWVDEGIDYHGLQNLFAASLPSGPRLFNEYHALLVRLGKDHCRKNPLCQGCPLEPMLPRTAP